MPITFPHVMKITEGIPMNELPTTNAMIEPIAYVRDTLEGSFLMIRKMMRQTEQIVPNQPAAIRIRKTSEND